MTMRVVPAVIVLTRGWLRAYTWRMPQHLADARRAEIESDLWEMQHDPDLSPGLHGGSIALARLVGGILDDIAWRFDNAAVEEHFVVRRVFALMTATVLVLSLWSAPSFVAKDDGDLAGCTATAPLPQTRAALLDEVVRCAGAFF